MYVLFPYEQLSAQEHREKLEILLAMFITYGESESFKRVLLAQEDDYLLRLINRLKLGGKL